jgi:RNA polymerase sigma factor (sigma-70 family)
LREHYATPAMSQVEVADLVVTHDITEATDDLEEDLAAVEEGLTRLPVVEREALTLFYLRELSLGEVADVLGVPIGTVKSRLFRARKLLRREVELGTRR